MRGESGLLTPEDRIIMKRGVRDKRRGLERKTRALMGYQADRRDSDVVLHAQRNRYDPTHWHTSESEPYLLWLWSQEGPIGGDITRLIEYVF